MLFPKQLGNATSGISIGSPGEDLYACSVFTRETKFILFIPKGFRKILISHLHHRKSLYFQLSRSKVFSS